MKNQNEGQEKKVEKENRKAERQAARSEKRKQEGKRSFKDVVKSKNFKARHALYAALHRLCSGHCASQRNFQRPDRAGSHR